MKVAYFDCFSGASGDMILGALLDAGLDLAELRAELSKLHLAGFEVSASRSARGGIGGTKCDVNVTEPPCGPNAPHRHLSDIREIIEHSGLSESIRADSLKVFQRLAEAEAEVHNTDPESIHFHEVGALDSIVDIVGAVIGLDALRLDKAYVSPISIGSGFVECAHGRLPVPAPATAALLKNFPTRGASVPRELTTPTGAAILTTLAEPAEWLPSATWTRVGYGLGGRENRELPNALRLFVGECASCDLADQMWVVEANIDDMPGELVGHALEAMLRAGAADAFVTPVQMKKSRPGILLSALVDSKKLNAVLGVYFSETTTFGVRMHQVMRQKLDRKMVEVATPFGRVAVKAAIRQGRIVLASPEYEACRAVASRTGACFRDVYQAALSAAQQLLLRDGRDMGGKKVPKGA